MSITEDYVSFETAKLLKEKGFEETSNWGYREDGSCVEMIDNPLRPPVYWGVTLQMAMKWLREVHGLNVQVFIIRTIELKKAYNATIYNNNCEQLKPYFGRNMFDGFNSYELACEAAIKYCLENLI